MTRITSGGFSMRDDLTQRLTEALNEYVLTTDRYYRIDTGIEHRFGDEVDEIHRRLYDSLGPTTDLLRYFPDALYFDYQIKLPTWGSQDEILENDDNKGLFTFFAEYKYTATECPFPINGVPKQFVGQIEREAWLTYKRLTSPNPKFNIYLDGMRSRIALFYAAPFAPDQLYADWEENIDPIKVKEELAIPGQRSLKTRGSGTPWINFDIRRMKPLPQFLFEDLYWDYNEAIEASKRCRDELFA